MRIRTLSWRLLVAAVAVLVVLPLATSQGFAATTFRVIDGEPLEIHVGADNAFQVFNSAVPGTGQIYPSSCQNIADMGVFANVDGVLFAPDFANHGCGSATAGIGTNTPWTSNQISPVSGQGTRTNPYSVTVTTNAGTTGVQMVMTVRYVNGENFFRINKSITSTASRSIKVWLGADIYLASSDAGIFYREPSFNAPGGQDCGVPATYSILLIPLTAAQAITASNYSNVWSQIGAAQLDNDTTPAGCVDNGAAIQWNVGASATAVGLEAAVSFGDIPIITDFVGFTVNATPPLVKLTSEREAEFLVTTQRTSEEFDAPLTLSVADVPEGFTATLEPDTIPAPGNGSSILRVTMPDFVFPKTYTIPILATGANETHGASVQIQFICNPPIILSLPADQPQSQTVAAGDRATLHVNVSGGSGPFSYQWYQGARGITSFPIRGVNANEMTTPPINHRSDFWVRVSNACGSADSMTATVSPSGSTKISKRDQN